MDEFHEYAKRRANALTYYPDVAAAGNLAGALIGAFAEMGSSLTAYSPAPPDEPIWSPFSDHPEAPGTTVPEYARVRVGGRICQVRIASFPFALVAFGLEFFEGEDETYDRLGNEVGTIVTNDLDTTAHIIRRALDDEAELSELAQEYGVIFRPPPKLTSSPSMDATATRMLAHIYEKLNAREELARPSDESEKRQDGKE